MSNTRKGLAQVWIGPEPEVGGHDSIVGLVVASPLGVDVSAGAWFTLHHGEWPPLDPVERAAEWQPWCESGSHRSTVPWHRVNCVDWYPEGTPLVEIIGCDPGVCPDESETGR